MKVKSTVCALGAMAGLSALAANLTVSSDVTNWEGLVLPDPGEELIIGSGVTATVTTREALAAIADCSRVRPTSETSRLEIVVPAGETWTNECPMSAVNLAGAGNKDFAKGELYKRGAGTLFLMANNRLKAGTSTLYDWWTCLTAAEGALRMPQNEPEGSHYVGYVSVTNGACFGIVESGTMFVRGLFGDGSVTNFGSVSRNITLMNEKVNKISDFSGSFDGPLSYNKVKDGISYLRGETGSASGSAYMAEGSTWVKKFGLSGEPSSFGSGTGVYIQKTSDVELGYLGTGETTTRELFLYPHPNFRAFLNGGEYGGLVWQGNIREHTDDGSMRELVFTGSNAENPCVVAGPVYGNYTSGSSVYGGLYYAKEGAGAWRFSDHYERKFSTGFAIREGTFEYDSLDERGRLSALGLATNLTAGAGIVQQMPQVDYAFALGSPTNSTIPAVFSYSGTNGYSCSTRPVALVGNGGHIRNDTARRIRLRGVSSLAGTGVKTLTLDGVGANTNEVADVTDGAGKTGVTKDGAGTWCLSGDLTFTGPLAVKEGTLIVRKTQPGVYKWFRWTIQQKHTRASDNVYDSEINISQIALFNAAGASQNRNLKLNDAYAELAPGEFGFQTVRTRVNLPYAAGKPETNPEDMFKGSSSYGMWARFTSPQSTSGVVQYGHLSDTWLAVVMRLSDAADEIAFFDYMNVWYAAAGQRNVKVSSLEGSVDGLHWDTLIADLEAPLYTESWTWAIAGHKMASSSEAHTDGAPVAAGSTDRTYSVLTGSPAVSVAPGARLVADGDATISHLAVDAASGMGEIDGFAFAAAGTIDLASVTPTTQTVAAQRLNATGLDNVKDWSVSVNGTDRAGYRVSASASGFKLIRPGLTVIVR